MAYLTSLDDVTQAVYDRVNSGRNALGLRAVYYADNNITSQHPNAVVVHGRKGKQRHTTGNVFRPIFTVYVYVLHADMTLSRALRTKADVQLAEATAAVIEGGDFSLGGQVVDCFVEAVEPAIMPGRRQGVNVVSSRITVYAESRG